MNIASVTVQKFRYPSRIDRDSEGHGHPGQEHDAVQSLLTITTDDGTSGHYFGEVNEASVEQIVQPLLIGEDPFYRERIWHALNERQRLNLSRLPDRVLTAVDLALWDLAGQVLGQPVHRILGAARDKVPAYASTMVGDDLEGWTGHSRVLRALRRRVQAAGLPGVQAPHLAAATARGAERQA
jgi:L-alanine-DL-glutamate epimerase-like enolase superfamily enzyme